MKAFDLKDLEDRGGFVPPDPFKVPVTWKHKDELGAEVTDTFEVFVVRKSAATINRAKDIARSIKKGGDLDELDMEAVIVSSFIRLGEKADQRISYEMALRLDEDLQHELIRAVNSCFDGKADPKNSAPPMNSGATSSPAASAAEPSQKPKSESPKTNSSSGKPTPANAEA